MSALVDKFGNPLTSETFARTKRKKLPVSDKEIGTWAGHDSMFRRLPGGGILQFDLDRLTLADYRMMRQHYQLGASLNVLSFVMHQIDWRIDCENQEIADFLTEEIVANWTNLIFALSQSFWAGYSPNALNFHNNAGHIRIKRIKDLVPEECEVAWETVEGWAPYGKPKPKHKIYDGISQTGTWIPPENSLWYPLLMENGDYFGRKLLKPAFPAWFFSNLIHLYANRYFERFGEPFPVGRAPFDDDVTLGDGTTVSGKSAMENIVANIRNRAVTVLPSDRDPQTKEFEYDIEYLESQMRGADFERYLSRLDEEMSLSVFTPILLFRTADVGSYNLGQAHLKIFEQMLNAIAGDQQFFIQNYLVDRLRVLNFGENSPKAVWSYRKLGTVDLAVYKEIVVEMIRQGAVKMDTEELGNIIGVGMEEQEILTRDPDVPGADPEADPADDQNPDPKTSNNAARAVLREATTRAARQLAKGDGSATLGFRNRYIEALQRDGVAAPDAATQADAVYSTVNGWLGNVGAVFSTADDASAFLDRLIDDNLAA